jgi:hypothetical protein
LARAADLFADSWAFPPFRDGFGADDGGIAARL